MEEFSARHKVRLAVQAIMKRLGLEESSQIPRSQCAIVLNRELAMEYKIDNGHDLLYRIEDNGLTNRVQDLFGSHVFYFGQFADVALYQTSEPMLQPTIVVNGKLMPLFDLEKKSDRG